MAVQITEVGGATLEPIATLANQYRITVPADIVAGDVMVVAVKYTSTGTNYFPSPLSGWTAASFVQYKNGVFPAPDIFELFVLYYKEKQANEFNVYDFLRLDPLTDLLVLGMFVVRSVRRSLSGSGSYEDQQNVSGTSQPLSVNFLDPNPSSAVVVDGGAGLMMVAGNPWATTSALTAYPAAMRSVLGGVNPRIFLGVEHFTADEARPAARAFTGDQTGAPAGTVTGFRSISLTFAPAFNTSMFHGVQF